MTTSPETGQSSTRDLATLITTLASGVLAFSVTFAEKLSEGVGKVVLLLDAAWVLLALAILFAVSSLSQLVHAQKADTLDWGKTALPPLRKSWWLFQGGMALLLLYGAIASGTRAWSNHSLAMNGRRTLLAYNTSGDVQEFTIRDATDVYALDTLAIGEYWCWAAPPSVGPLLVVRVRATGTETAGSAGKGPSTISVDTLDFRRQSLRMQVHEPLTTAVPTSGLVRTPQQWRYQGRTTVVPDRPCAKR
jgi:hypothetical protein